MNALESLIQKVEAAETKFKTEKIDVRRHRKYRRDASLSFQVSMDDQECRECLDIPINRHLKEGNVSAWRYSQTYGFVVREKFLAEKPSLIISEQKARERLPSEEEFKSTVVSAMKAAWAAHERAEKDEQEARHAQTIAMNCGKTITENARHACRIDQRIAALRAELKAEVEIQKKKMIAELEKNGVTFLGGERASERAVKTAVENIDKFVSAAVVNHGFGIRPTLRVEDLVDVEGGEECDSE